jgi:hypothetical protein
MYAAKHASLCILLSLSPKLYRTSREYCRWGNPLDEEIYSPAAIEKYTPMPVMKGVSYFAQLTQPFLPYLNLRG